MARGRVYRHDARSPHCRSTLRRAQEDAQGRLRGWPTGLQLGRLWAALRARRGLSPSWAGDEGAGLGDIYGRERLERHWAGVGVRRSGGAGLGEKGGRIALNRLRERNARRRESWRPVKLRWWCTLMRCGLTGEPGAGISGRIAGSGRRWQEKLTAAAGWISRWGTAVKVLSCGCMKGCPKRALRQAQEYRSGAYQVYLGWLPPERHVAGRGGAVKWNEGLHPVWRP